MNGFDDMQFLDYKGRKVPPFLNILERLSDFEENFKSREDDIWICAFPKCGTHWINEIIRMLLTDSLEKGPPKERFMVEYSSHREWDKMESTRLLNTHLAVPIVPKSVFNNKIVHIIRNFKDVFVSYYHHYLSFSKEETPMTWENFYNRILINNEVFQYHHEWMKAVQEHPETILVLHFEEIKSNPVENIKRIAKFLGLEKTDAYYQSIAEATGFETMKSRYETQTAEVDNTGMSFSVGKLYRKGIVGDWKNWFTDAQNKEFNERYKREIDGLVLGIEQYMDL